MQFIKSRLGEFVLSIRPIGSSSQQVNYYVNLGVEDYYTNGGEPPGVWRGVAAKQLGLSGRVNGQELRNLLRGYSADGKSKLVQNAGLPNRRSAFDLTWTVPKSVSIARSLASENDRKLIDQCCDTAISRSIEAFQQLCGTTRLGHNGENVQNAKLAMAVFRHETARAVGDSAPDPNLHWHVVVPNIAVRQDGSTGAFDARRLFGKNMKMALGALFRAELSKQLQSIGLRTYRPKKKRSGDLASWFELECIPSELILEFSKRRKEISDWLSERGLSGAKNAEKAALTTRQAKKITSHDKLFDNWKSVGKSFGVDSTTIEASVNQQRLTPTTSATNSVVNRGLSRITNNYSTFTKTELIRFAAEEAQTLDTGIEQILSEVDVAVRSDGRLIKLIPNNGVATFTTPEMLAEEKKLLSTSEQLSLRRNHIADQSYAERKIVEHKSLHPEQADAIKHIVFGSDIVCVNGVAGSGKTYMLSISGDILKESGYQVIGTALAAKASKTLQQESGIKSTHIHDLLWQLDQGKMSLDSTTVLVVDEAGMLGTRLLSRLASLVDQSKAKLVLIGDRKQLPAISAGAPFRKISERFGVFEMNHIRRQREKWARKTVYDFRDGRAQDALLEYQKRGQLFVGQSPEEAIKQLVEDWSSFARSDTKLKDCLVFAGTNLEVAMINAQCQKTRLELKQLGRKVLIDGSPYYQGDRIMITKNLRSLGLRNGSTGIVREIDTGINSISVEFDDGFKIWIELDVFSDFKLAYAVSTHKGQGQTVENAFVLAGGMMSDREITYVQSSRARGKTKFYTDIISRGETLEHLAAKMNRSRAKDMALDSYRELV